MSLDYPRDQMSEIFVEGFYTWISRFSKDKALLKSVFEHMFLPENFFLAYDGSKVTAMLAITKGVSPISLNRRIFVEHMGFFKGNIAYFLLRHYMVRNHYPFPLAPTTGIIEFVATHPDYRGQGIAGELMERAMCESPYTSFILEVADTNISAMKLYTRLGFREMMRIKAPRRSGVNFFLYMRRSDE